MIEILTKIRAKITIIVVENREPYYFIIIIIIIICKCKGVRLSLFSHQMLARTLTTDERSVYYKVYAVSAAASCSSFARKRFRTLIYVHPHRLKKNCSRRRGAE